MEKVEALRNPEVLGGIAIFYRHRQDLVEFLVVKNATTGNITFVSGAKEDTDASEVDTIKREILEELELNIAIEILQPTNVRHRFIFGAKKKERAGLPGSYQVFLIDATNMISAIHDTAELKVQWMNKDEALNALSFPDLKEVFLQAVRSI